MNILIVLRRFCLLTGSELYVYELSKELVLRGHTVCIVAHAGGEITKRARQNGVIVHNFLSFRFSKARRYKYDILHLNQYISGRRILQIIDHVPAVATIHSFVRADMPLVNERIKKYICVRPEIQENIVRTYGILPDKTVIVYNGIDFDRFSSTHTKPRGGRKLIVFSGTVDSLRKQCILHLIERSKHENFDIWLVGHIRRPYLLFRLPSNVTHFPATWNIEKYIKQADETAGILLGRTTIEGWACGKPGWIYDVDMSGSIKSVALYQPPSDMRKYNIKYMIDKIETIYSEAIT